MQKTVFDFATGETTQRAFTAEELAERNAREVTYVEPTPPAPTKEQLLAQLNALSAQIQALE
jgi:hypothetical protein